MSLAGSSISSKNIAETLRRRLASSVLIDLEGHSRGVSDILATQDKLLHDARSLLQALGSAADAQARYSPFKRDAARLGAEVRAHEAQEAALIYETDVRVTGGEG